MVGSDSSSSGERFEYLQECINSLQLKSNALEGERDKVWNQIMTELLSVNDERTDFAGKVFVKDGREMVTYPTGTKTVGDRLQIQHRHLTDEIDTVQSDIESLQLHQEAISA